MPNRFSAMVFVVLGLLFSGFAKAETLETKITSFVYTDMNSHVAELCGHVIPTKTSVATNAIVNMVIDKGQAKYTALADDDGNFCSVVITYYGTATATAKSAK